MLRLLLGRMPYLTWTILSVLVHIIACEIDFKRTVVLIKVNTELGENVFLRGGNLKCQNYGRDDPCSIPIRYKVKSGTSAAYQWSIGDNYLDWQGAETTQSVYNEVPASGSPLIWTTSKYVHGNPTVERNGYGFSPLNQYGSGYLLLDVDMDCSATDNGWFQFKSYISPTSGWETNVNQTAACGGEVGGTRPVSTMNHQGRCGYLNLFVYGSSGCVIRRIQSSSPSDVKCGMKRHFSRRVVDGQPSAEGNWPWMAEILYKGNHGCGAVLISPTWAITAGHCVRTAQTYGPWTVILRTGETNRYKLGGRERDYFIKNIIKHPLFDRPGSSISNDNDIALLELSSPVTVDDDVTPACMPSHFSDINEFTDKECWIIGWGSTRGTGDRMILQQLQVNVSSSTTCTSLYGHRVSDRQICAGNGTKQACQGDSGSPLSCKVNNRWYVVGVVSWGDDNCIGRPSVFTRITHFLPWIQHNTGLQFNHDIIG